MAVKQLKYTGETKDGRLLLPIKMEREVCQAYPDAVLDVIVKKQRRPRTNPQNAYYWAVVVEYCRQGIIDLWGEPLDHSQVHETLGWTYLKRQKIDERTGEVVLEYVESTTNLSTAEMTEYIERCRGWAAMYLGIQIPDPER